MTFIKHQGFTKFQGDWDKVRSWGHLDRSSSQIRERYRRLMKSPMVPSLPLPSNSNQTPPSTPNQSVQSSPPQQSSSMNPTSSLSVPSFTPITPTNIGDGQTLAPPINVQVPGSPAVANGKRKGPGVRTTRIFLHFFVISWLSGLRALTFCWLKAKQIDVRLVDWKTTLQIQTIVWNLFIQTINTYIWICNTMLYRLSAVDLFWNGSDVKARINNVSQIRKLKLQRQNSVDWTTVLQCPAVALRLWQYRPTCQTHNWKRTSRPFKRRKND